MRLATAARAAGSVRTCCWSRSLWFTEPYPPGWLSRRLLTAVAPAAPAATPAAAATPARAFEDPLEGVREGAVDLDGAVTPGFIEGAVVPGLIEGAAPVVDGVDAALREATVGVAGAVGVCLAPDADLGAEDGLEDVARCWEEREGVLERLPALRTLPLPLLRAALERDEPLLPPPPPRRASTSLPIMNTPSITARTTPRLLVLVVMAFLLIGHS